MSKWTAEEVEAMAADLRNAPGTSMLGTHVSIPTPKAAAIYAALCEYAGHLSQPAERGEAAAWLVVDEEGSPSMLFFDRLEALNYCDDDEQPTPLYTDPPPAAGVPDGWTLVPIEPTEEMLNSINAHGELVGRDDLRDYYKAMLSAAPESTPSPAIDYHVANTTPPPAAGVPDELVLMTIGALDDVDTEMRATGRATNRFSQLASDWRGMLSATPSRTIDVTAVREVIEKLRILPLNRKVMGISDLDIAKELARAIGDAK